MVEKSEEFLYSVWEDHTNTGIANVRNRREDQELKGRTDQPREHWWKCIEVPKGPIGLGTICVKGMKRSLKELVNRCAFMSHILEKRPDHSCLVHYFIVALDLINYWSFYLKIRNLLSVVVFLSRY
ncbi:uncharacterized protein LOC107863440 isoform X2 [Capsicum annuum]|uniref:uncharacterized protein LOC107863440 isoform X2 n=1 Tax=Capsicum annuum TaxID=4072 RepID=UPI001FB05CDF|nr:uncharacterized protein LOC107863440 isoform X2 [Capsicum annuum]XP_047264507.1 uncharacterized protein LOC107863440 isoform X2 [Capsicum annuum]